MATKRYPLEKPVNKALAIGYIIDGLSDAEVAAALAEKRVTVTRQAITAFRHKYQDEIAPVVEQVEKQITDYAIAHKVNRIAGLQALADEVQAVIDGRGLIERQVTTTEHAEIVRERFARELPAELRSIYRAAAEELAQLPKPEINIDNRTQILIREYGGIDVSRIG